MLIDGSPGKTEGLPCAVVVVNCGHRVSLNSRVFVEDPPRVAAGVGEGPAPQVPSTDLVAVKIAISPEVPL